jgi:hypothetical protein
MLKISIFHHHSSNLIFFSNMGVHEKETKEGGEV